MICSQILIQDDFSTSATTVEYAILRDLLAFLSHWLLVEFYLCPTVVSTALIYFLKPELNKWDQIEYGVRSNWVIDVFPSSLGNGYSF